MDHVISADESETIEIAIKTWEKLPTCSITKTRMPYTRQYKDSATVTTASLMPPFCWNNWTNLINEARTEKKTPTGLSFHQLQ